MDAGMKSMRVFGSFVQYKEYKKYKNTTRELQAQGLYIEKPTTLLSSTVSVRLGTH